MARFCDAILSALGDRRSVVSVSFVSAGKMRTLNQLYRGGDNATDVLSFGYADEEVEGAPFLGEIVIAPEVARRQARVWRTPPERELRRLLVHGILHLLGYDHETDTGEMRRLQMHLLRRRVFLDAVPVADMGDRE